MDIRTLSVGLVSFGLFAGAGALVVGHSSHTARPHHSIARTALSPIDPPEGDKDEDDKDDAEGEDEDQVITFDQAPAPVQAAALKLAGDAKNITQITREEEDDVAMFDVEFTENGAKCSAEFTAEGDLVEMEKSVDASKLPAPVLAALKEEYPSMNFGETKMITRIVYQLTIKVDGKDHEITVTPCGSIEDDCCDDEDENGDCDDHDEGEEHEAHSGPGSHNDPA